MLTVYSSRITFFIIRVSGGSEDRGTGIKLEGYDHITTKYLA